MATPFPFGSGNVLTAAQMNAITTLPINDQTASYSAVVGDVGQRIVMNVATANTVTIDNAIFAVGDTIFVANKGAGATTVTAGSGVTINSASGLVLVQHQSGQLVALSASSFLFVLSAGGAAGGLICVKAETAFTGSTTINADNVFSASFTNYMVMATLTGTTGDDLSLRLRVGGVDNSTASSYVRQGTQTNGTSLSGFRANSAQTKFSSFNTSGTSFSMFQFCNPFNATGTSIYGNFAEPGAASTIDSQYTFHNVASSFDGFSLLCLSTGNVTGSFTVYGYSKTV